MFRAFQGRIDWSSLLAAYEASYKIAKEDPRRYREMAAASVRRMKDHCGQVQVLKKLQTLIASVSERTPPASIEEDIQP